MNKQTKESNIFENLPDHFICFQIDEIGEYNLGKSVQTFTVYTNGQQQ